MESGVVTDAGRSRGGTLYLVSTPIGNMGDFSFRAVEVLQSVAAIYAEDTRHSRRLLEHYGIATPLVPHHEHNEARSTPDIVARLLGGDDVALISDAGTPLLSDPGERLVAAAIAAGVAVAAVPGASAVLAALVASGLPLQPFTFFGFLARKGSERSRELAAVASLSHTAVLYEAAGRVAATLRDLVQHGCGDRAACVARELTKKFEELRRGTVSELATYYENTTPRGEVVILVGGAAAPVADAVMLEELARELREQGRPARDTVRELMRRGASRNLAYRLAHLDRHDASLEDPAT